MRRHDFADSLTCRSTGVDGTTNSRNIATHDGSNEASIDLFPADEAHIRRFHHRIGGFNHRHQTTAFDHSKCFRHAAIVPKLGHKGHKASPTKSTRGFSEICF